MILKGLLSVLVLLALQPLTVAEVTDRPTIEHELTAVLRAEILWNDTPKVFRAPGRGSVTIAINAMPNAVSYCSHDLGACAKYGVLDFRNWLRLTSVPCRGQNSDLDALLAFLGQAPVKGIRHVSPPVALGPGGFTGSPTPGSGVSWIAKISLNSRSEIVKEYQQMRPADIKGLTNWLRSATTSHSGVRAITVACYSPFDPLVYYYVDRSSGTSVIMAVFWDKDRQKWVPAASFERSQAPEQFDELRRTIESIPCSTVTSQ